MKHISCRYCEKPVRVNWNVFFENSSETDSLHDFAFQKQSIKQLSFGTWTPESKLEVAKLKKMKVGMARKLAQSALRRRGYGSWS